ncbi:MAG: DUF6089 family protein [Bacteroidota bacterium]|nr:DUF6089 family protein [Bacteroidota bacterium]
MKKRHYIVVLFFLLFQTSFAQNLKNKKSAEIGIFLGGSYYIGDLNPIKHFNQFTKPAAGIVFRYNFNYRLAGRVNVLMGTLEAHDEFSNSGSQQQRNLSFKSQLTEFSAQLEFNFLDYQIGNDKRKFSPYIFFGLAGFRFNPQGQLNNNWVALQPLGTEGQGLPGGASKKKYKLMQISIPFGLGIKTNLSRNISLAVEWGMRKTFTDYLDDVSKKYYDPAVLAATRGTEAALLSDPSIGTDPNFSNVGRQRGNPTTKDWYSFAGLVLTIKLKEKVERCPGVN